MKDKHLKNGRLSSPDYGIIQSYPVFRIRIRIASGFNQVSGSQSGSEIRNWIRKQEAEMTHKNIKKSRNMFWSAGCSPLRAEGFSWSLDVIYGALGISKLLLLIQKNFFLMAVNFLQFLVIKPWIRIRIGIKPKIPDPDSINPVPKHCFFYIL